MAGKDYRIFRMDDSQLAPCPFGYLESERFRIRVRK